MSLRTLSPIALPTMTRFSNVTGGELMLTWPTPKLASPFKSTVPFPPKSVHGLPVAASSAIRRPSITPSKMRLAHAAPACGCASRHAATPRQRKGAPSVLRVSLSLPI
jgi:hypothetical protein